MTIHGTSDFGDESMTMMPGSEGERLDVDYIRRWSTRLGVADLLDRAVGDAER